MHIPASMLHGNICPVTLGVGALGVTAAIYMAAKAKAKPSAAKFIMVTTLVFALQALEFSVQNGTSCHFVGGVMAAAILGIPFATIAISLVLAAQALFFGDGGLNALGANIINMAFIGAVVGGIVSNALRAKGVNRHFAVSFAAWFSVVLAAAACSLEIALSGTAQLPKAMPEMVKVHALIGFYEAAVTLIAAAILKLTVSISYLEADSLQKHAA